MTAALKLPVSFEVKNLPSVQIFCMTALAVVLSAFMTDALTDALLDNISLVGNILIFCVGINLVWPRTIKVANLLPALLAAIALTGIV